MPVPEIRLELRARSEAGIGRQDFVEVVGDLHVFFREVFEPRSSRFGRVGDDLSQFTECHSDTVFGGMLFEGLNIGFFKTGV